VNEELPKTGGAKEGTTQAGGKGDDSEPAAGDELQPTHARKARGKRWEQVRREARGSGKTRREAIAHANTVCAAEFPELASEYPPPPDPETPTQTPPDAQEAGVAGLGDLPADWPELPANASLQADVQWVAANRLTVLVSPGVVDLSRALAPAPSYSALDWLDTALCFPSKFADVRVKATQHAEDEREHARRERLAVEETHNLLAEMAGAAT